LNLKTPLRIWLLAGAFSLVVAAVVLTLCTPTVLANVLLSISAAPPPAAVRPVPAPPTPQQVAQQRGDKLRGLASWYGGPFNGQLTANGERYNMYAMTACHDTLPFGSIVRVVDLRNHRSVVVRINDRGYLYKGRVIDLSYAAAKQLAMVKPGLAPVQLHVLSLGGIEIGKLLLHAPLAQ
jgi:peptidoglycan lytic transglycosylase